MKNITNILIISFLFVSNICRAQSIMPNDTSDLQQVQNFEFVSLGNIILTSKAVLVDNGANFTNGFMQFEKIMNYPIRSFTMDYDYTTENGIDTALVKLIFRNANNTKLGEMSIPINEQNIQLNIGISNPNFVHANKIEVLAYSSKSPWIGKGNILEIKSMVASNQIRQSSSNYQIFPNPTNSVSQLNSLDGSNINNIKIMNNNGVIVDQHFSINNFSYQIDFSDFISGLYHILIYSSSGISSKRVVVN